MRLDGNPYPRRLKGSNDNGITKKACDAEGEQETGKGQNRNDEDGDRNSIETQEQGSGLQYGENKKQKESAI